MADVVVIDSGGANLASLLHALRRLGSEATVSNDPERIRAASHVLLPGVGAANDAMTRLRAAGVDTLLPTLTQPLLGICLGMQLLFEASEEAVAGATETRCLGLVPGRVRRLQAEPGLPVPHMGWNQLEPLRDDPLFDGIRRGDYVYFVHSYCAPVSDATLAKCTYGETFSAVVQRGHVYGTQFHPERSGRIGSLILRNFLRIA